MTDLPDIDLRKEWTRLRALLYETSDLALSTDERDGHRWLTDRFVLLDVTGSVAVEGVADGCYKLVQARGFEAREGYENYLNGGIVDYLESVERGADWLPVRPSEWSVAEHPGKAMLFVAGDLDGFPRRPVLMGESTWTTFHRHFGEGLVVEYDVSGRLNLFRCLDGAAEGRFSVVLAYVAGIRIPDGQEKIAKAIAELVDTQSTSN